MAKIINRHQHWSSQDITLLRKLAKEKAGIRVIAIALGRSEISVKAKARELNIKLKSTSGVSRVGSRKTSSKKRIEPTRTRSGGAGAKSRGGGIAKGRTRSGGAKKR